LPRLVYLLGVGISLVAGAFLLTDALVAPPPGVTELNIDRLQPRMPCEKVQRIFGRAPDRRIPGEEGTFSLVWEGKAFQVEVGFDAQGRLVTPVLVELK
jgi:hypothetical protein